MSRRGAPIAAIMSIISSDLLLAAALYTVISCPIISVFLKNTGCNCKARMSIKNTMVSIVPMKAFL